MDGGQLDSADHAILNLLQQAVGAAEANSQGAQCREPHISLTLPKTASPNWRLWLNTIVISQSALKIGQIRF
jgi:hypothetical protein